MNLWSEYEGRTIDGAYPLTKLIRPEGRSAFFYTSNGTGAPTVIRLIESHFDGDEILTRWRGVAALNHPNLVKLKSFGQVVVDDTSLVYTVMEPVDANLSEILNERRLTELETKQIANSLLGAIEALHSNGFVHEHIEPANVLAVDEVIKLRSDCIREAPEGEEGCELKRRDVHDYAVVLLQALTQQRTLEDATRDLPLPAPFEEIVRKAMSGEWGLAQIGGALNSVAVVQPVARPVVRSEARVEIPVAETPAAPPLVAERVRVPVNDGPRGFGLRGIAYGVGALLILLLGWYFVHGRSASSNGAVQEGKAPAPVAQQDAAAGTGTGSSVSPSAPVPARNAPVPAEQKVSGDSNGSWRVIAFTYNDENEAQQEVATIAGSHPDLNPAVFTLNGRAPFLVTLGGLMNQRDAFALSGKAKREGLPKDVYARNYRRIGR